MDYYDNDYVGVEYKNGDTITFNYVKNFKTLNLRPGRYQFECWGASGAGWYPYVDGGSRRGLGGYTIGTIELFSPKTFYIYVGGTADFDIGGWNGGGSAFSGGGAGGGASDIRLASGNWNNTTSLRSRIMVAAGGGGSNNWTITSNPNDYGCKRGDVKDGSGGNGGGITGENGIKSGNYNIATIPGSQTNGANFGFGSGSRINTKGGAGGGGYYGGTGGESSDNGGAGGSSFISGMIGCDAIDDNGKHTGKPEHYSELFFVNSFTRGGIRDGNGLIKISIIDVKQVFLTINSYKSRWEQISEL